MNIVIGKFPDDTSPVVMEKILNDGLDDKNETYSIEKNETKVNY